LINVVLNISYTIKKSFMTKKSAEICLQCGVCCVVKGYSCPAQYDKQFTPTETYVYNCLSHENPSSNRNIWQCVSCHKCEELCPYEVSPIEFIETMKQRALETGNAPDSIKQEIKQVISTGYAFPVTSHTSKTRKSLGLKELLPNKELKIIANKTGIMDLLQRGE